MFASLFLAAAAAAATTANAAQTQIVCRVRDLGNGPKIYVDGKTEPHNWIWVRDTIRNLPISGEWHKFDIPMRSPVDVKGCGILLRIANEPGRFEARGIRIVGSDGSVFPITKWSVAAPEHRPFVSWSVDPTNGLGRLAMDFTSTASAATNVFFRHPLEMTSPRKDFKGGVTYRVQMEVRGEGVSYFRPAVCSSGDDNFRAWREEVPPVDGEYLSSCVQVEMAGRNGANVVTYMTPSCWFDGKDDFSAAIEQAERLLKANPNALLVPRISLAAPPWWIRKHPGDRVVLHTGEAIDVRYGNVSSETYRREAMEYLAKYIRALQEAFPRNFAGVHPSMQSTGECFYPESWKKMCGYDPHTLREWRRWLKAKGAADWATAEVPRPEDRRKSNGETRVFDVSDPVQARCVEFARFQQAEMVRLVRDVCRVCRTETDGKKLVVVFYGYTWEFSKVHQGPAATGHYGVELLLKTIGDDLDVISSPLAYDVDRRFCGSTPLMHASETFMRHGILPVYEDDSRTHLDQRLAPVNQEGELMDEGQTIEMLTRNKGVLAVHGFESWWMDLRGQGEYADEDIWKICRDLREADLANANRAKAYAPPVALFQDEESMIRLCYGGRSIFAPLTLTSRHAFARTGAGAGQYLLSDVAARPLDAKLQVHLSSWALDEKTVGRLVADRAARPDVTRVWCWMPGCLTDHGFDASAGERLTGFRFRRATVKVPVATATAEGRARGLPETLAVSKEEFKWDAGAKCDTLLTVEPEPGDEVWATWEDGTPAVVARKNAGGDGLNVYYGVNVFDWQTASALVRAAGVFSHFAANDGQTTLCASEDLVVLQAQTDGRREIVYPKATKLLDVREKKTLDASDRFAFDLKKGDVKVLLVQ